MSTRADGDSSIFYNASNSKVPRFHRSIRFDYRWTSTDFMTLDRCAGCWALTRAEKRKIVAKISAAHPHTKQQNELKSDRRKTSVGHLPRTHIEDVCIRRQRRSYKVVAFIHLFRPPLRLIIAWPPLGSSPHHNCCSPRKQKRSAGHFLSDRFYFYTPRRIQRSDSDRRRTDDDSMCRKIHAGS